jgi:hypothetical protein
LSLRVNVTKQSSTGASLLDDLAVFVRRYVVLKPEEADVLALYKVHTHAIGAAEFTPYLSITSPVLRCGNPPCWSFWSCSLPSHGSPAV